jgi:hypothetical protein
MIGNSNFVFLPLLATESLQPHNKPDYVDKNKKRRHQTKNSLSLSRSLSTTTQPTSGSTTKVKNQICSSNGKELL